VSSTTLRYAARFQCIGSDCEDTCCAHAWRVKLDRPDYDRLKRAVADSAEERERFERGCKRTAEVSGGDGSYAALQWTPAGQCVFLTPDHLCSIHQVHGPAALPKVCVTYPRLVSKIGHHVTATDALSCPEAARLCLLAEDAVEVEAARPETLRGFLVRRQAPASREDPLFRHFLAVRGAFLAVLGARDYPLASRLCFAAHLARRFDAARGESGRRAQDAAVHRAIRAGGSAGTLAARDRACRAERVSGALPFVLVQRILMAVLLRHSPGRFAALVEEIYAPYLDEEGEGHRLRGGELWQTYRVRRREWQGRFADRIAQYIGNYAANYFMREPFTVAPDLQTHVLHLLARVAAIRFLLFNHPALQALAASTSSRPLREQALDRAVVDVVYSFSRTLEHNEGLRELLQGLLREFRVKGVRQVPELARF
jgi:lysine-N-methylase